MPSIKDFGIDLTKSGKLNGNVRHRLSIFAEKYISKQRAASGTNDTEDLNPINRFGRTQMMFAVRSRIALQYQYFDSGENLR